MDTNIITLIVADEAAGSRYIKHIQDATDDFRVRGDVYAYGPSAVAPPTFAAYRVRVKRPGNLRNDAGADVGDVFVGQEYSIYAEQTNLPMRMEQDWWRITPDGAAALWLWSGLVERLP